MSENLEDHLNLRMRQLATAEDESANAKVMCFRLAEALRDMLKDVRPITRIHAKEVLAMYDETVK